MTDANQSDAVVVLLELAERCERAEGPDRELDALIAPLQGLRVVDEGHPIGRMCYDDIGCAQLLPRYTASLDAAMTLVPEEFGRPSAFTIQRSRNFGCCAVVWVNSEFNRSVRGDADTPALALCAAALRARSAGGEKG